MEQETELWKAPEIQRVVLVEASEKGIQRWHWGTGKTISDRKPAWEGKMKLRKGKHRQGEELAE